MSFFTGFGVSAIVYWLLVRAFPVPGMARVFEEVDVSLGEERDGDGDDGSVSEEGSKEGREEKLKARGHVYAEEVKP
jgi:NCS1 family nucleobase:cation symporter-1